MKKIEQSKRGRAFRKKTEEAEHECGKCGSNNCHHNIKDPHGSGKNHPFGAVHPFTEGQRKQITNFLDESGMVVRIVVENNKHFNWHDIVFATSLGIIVGVIIASI